MLITLDELYLKVSTTKAHVSVHYTCVFHRAHSTLQLSIQMSSRRPHLSDRQDSQIAVPCRFAATKLSSEALRQSSLDKPRVQSASGRLLTGYWRLMWPPQWGVYQILSV